MPLKRTKIIATLGPASSTAEVIRELIRAGTDAFRLNFSHGSASDHAGRVELIRSVAGECGRHIAIVGDLQGPKIRIGRFAAGHEPTLNPGEEFTIDCSFEGEGDERRIGVTWPDLARDCRAGQVLLLDDGRIELEIVRIEAGKIETRVLVGGKLGSSKGINLRNGGLSAPALTDKDFADIGIAAELDLDYLAISFPRHAEDMERAREAVGRSSSRAGLIAKVERAEAVADADVLDGIIRASDAVMVARGDLGVEIGDSELIGVQKQIIRRARQLNRIVITATQMMESMIESSLPTRAEVFDVANAVLDGTDVVMLSAETAVGRNPVKVVEAMTRIILGAEKHSVSQPVSTRRQEPFRRPDEAIAVAAMFAANHYPAVRAILCLTESGTTPLWMSRIRSGIPIYAYAAEPRVLRRMALYRGVTGLQLPSPDSDDPAALIRTCLELLREGGYLNAGEQVLATSGEHLGEQGGTNSLKILVVPAE